MKGEALRQYEKKRWKSAPQVNIPPNKNNLEVKRAHLMETHKTVLADDVVCLLASSERPRAVLEKSHGRGVPMTGGLAGYCYCPC